MTITASSNQPKSYRYRLLDQIWRDACSDSFEWRSVPESTNVFNEKPCGRFCSLATGDTITCQGLPDGSHSFTFEQGEK